MEFQWIPLWWCVMYFCQGGRDDLIQKALDKAGLLALLLVFAWNPLNNFWAVCVYHWSGYASANFSTGAIIFNMWCLMMSRFLQLSGRVVNRRFETRNMVSTQRISAPRHRNSKMTWYQKDPAMAQFLVMKWAVFGQTLHWISRHRLIISNHHGCHLTGSKRKMPATLCFFLVVLSLNNLCITDCCIQTINDSHIDSLFYLILWLCHAFTKWCATRCSRAWSWRPAPEQASSGHGNLPIHLSLPNDYRCTTIKY